MGSLEYVNSPSAGIFEEGFEGCHKGAVDDRVIP